MGECVFCSIVSGDTAAEIVLSDDHVVAFLDRAPLFKGHVLVVPRAHVGTLDDLATDEVGRYFRVVQRVAASLPGALSADGAFVAINNVVSQSVPHLHTHVVPRRRKDGLRGFFWPRQRYVDAAELESYALTLRVSLEAR